MDPHGLTPVVRLIASYARPAPQDLALRLYKREAHAGLERKAHRVVGW